MGAPEKVFEIDLGDSPTGAWLEDVARRIGAAGPVGFQVGTVLRGIGGYLEHKVSLDMLSKILIQAGANISAMPQARKPSPPSVDG